MIIDGLIVIVSTLITVISSTLVRINKRQNVPDIQPKSSAFSIWGLIFILLIVNGAILLFDNEKTHTSYAILISLALFSCTSWLFLQKYNPMLSIAAMYFALVFAAASCFYIDIIGGNLAFKSIGPGLLTGWLTIAASLATIIHLEDFWGQKKSWHVVLFLIINALLTGTQLFVSKNRVCALSITLPLLWASIMSRSEKSALSLGIPGTLQVGFILGFLLKDC